LPLEPAHETSEALVYLAATCAKRAGNFTGLLRCKRAASLYPNTEQEFTWLMIEREDIQVASRWAHAGGNAADFTRDFNAAITRIVGNALADHP